MKDQEIVQWVLACREEADEAKRDRMAWNKDNYDMFHLRHDFSHKRKGQSTEVLSRQSMAVEQIKAFFQQALADVGEWWKAESQYPEAEEAMLIRPGEITKLTNYMLEKSAYFSHVGNCVQSAVIGSLAITKTYGCMKPKPRYVAKTKGRGKSFKRWLEKIEDKTWELKFETVRAEDFYPDPTGKGLYVIEDMWMDYYEVLKLSEGEYSIYDRAAVLGLSKGSISSDSEFDKARESGQNPTTAGHRPKVKITELWGSILDKEGNVVYENVVCTIANDTTVIRKPEPNPLWHQKYPYLASPLLEVDKSVWHKSIMDAPTKHNRALTEMYNLMVDAGMQEVHALKQLRKSALDNPAQVAEGILPGSTIVVNDMLQPGMKVIEELTTTRIPSESFNIFNIMGQEFNSSALTNDLRSGVMSPRAVKATEVVEASNAITSIFQGIAKNYEVKHSVRELELAWMTTAQNWDLISKEEFIALFGPQRGEELSQLSPEEVFAATVNGIKFRVFGISLTLAKANDFKKLTTLMQTVAASPMLMELFMEKYDLSKLLGEIMTSLNIDKEKLEIPKAQQMTMEAQPEGAEGGPQDMSQVPSAAGGGLADLMGGADMSQSQQMVGNPSMKGMNNG